MNCKTAVILAAGAGTRMKSDKPKVLHEICGKPMVTHVTSQAAAAGSDNIIVIVGHGADKVQSAIDDGSLRFALQKEQLGTGHAVMQAKDLIPDEGDVFVLCGDTPLITSDTLKKFAAYHSEKKTIIRSLKSSRTNLLNMILQPWIKSERIPQEVLNQSLRVIDVPRTCRRELEEIIENYALFNGSVFWKQEDMSKIKNLVQQVAGVNDQQLASIQSADQLVELVRSRISKCPRDTEKTIAYFLTVKEGGQKDEH
jgi:molybdopterin-guanine dinucleotide biosynthesis protein A